MIVTSSFHDDASQLAGLTGESPHFAFPVGQTTMPASAPAAIHFPHA